MEVVFGFVGVVVAVEQKVRYKSVVLCSRYSVYWYFWMAFVCSVLVLFD